ncbi:hypothetical protein [Persicobacter psychrovividus]|uniref:Uncharacterized protein n=1 Tax=Persicobacter psychrovividus TaxID=387638 RepID=A0ABN6L5K5_9BACT|nr:hypothetical protein PEPS_07230 [Persicobacter psychrovividus]
MERKCLLFFSLFLCLFFSTLGASAQKKDCGLKIDHKVIDIDSNHGNIQLTLENKSTTLELKLYNLSEGSKSFDEVKEVQFVKNTPQVVFSNLKSAVYVVQVVASDGCQFSLGGIQGILVGKK